jgi:hypothetical protein
VSTSILLNFLVIAAAATLFSGVNVDTARAADSSNSIQQASSVEDTKEVEIPFQYQPTSPSELALDFYPRLFSPNGIRMDLPSRRLFTIEVFNLKGSPIVTMSNRTWEQGSYYFRAVDLARNGDSGVYFVKLTSCKQQIVKKFVLLK